MDRKSLHDLLEAATATEPSAGAIPQNALRAGIRLRRHRRARFTATGAAVVAVACAAALAMASGSGRPAAAPGQGTIYVLSNTSDQALVTPISAATGTPGQPIVVATGSPFAPMLGAGPMVVSPDGKTIWVTGGGDTVTVISTTTDKAEKTIRLAPANLATMQILANPDGKTVYVLDSLGTVTPISTATEQPETPIRLGLGPQGDEMAITPDGRTLYVVKSITQPPSQPASEVIPIDSATGRPGTPVRVTVYGGEMVITPDGRTAYVIGGSASAGEVTPFSTTTDQPGTPVALPPDADGANPLMAPGGRTMYFPVEAPPLRNGLSGVLPFSTVTNTLGKMISVGSWVSAGVMAITPDGGTLYVVTDPLPPYSQCSWPGPAVVPVSTVTGIAGNPIRAGGCQPEYLAITPDGSTVYVASAVPSQSPPPIGWEGTLTPVTTSTNQPGKTVSVTGDPVQVVVAP